MAIQFKDLHESRNCHLFQDGLYIAFIRYTRIDGYIVDYEDDVSLDIVEQKTILDKMIELQKDAKEV